MRKHRRVCDNGTNIPNGYGGTGQLSIDITNIVKIHEGGSYTTIFWRVGAGDQVSNGGTKYLSPAVTYTSSRRAQMERAAVVLHPSE